MLSKADLTQCALDSMKINLYDFTKMLTETEDTNVYKWMVICRSYFDLKFFSKFFFSYEKDGELAGHCKDPFNKMHLEYFKEFNPKESGENRVLRAARGSAKTTLIALIDPMHRICYANEPFTVIMSSTKPLSLTKTATIREECEYNSKLKSYYQLTISKAERGKEHFGISSIFGRSYVWGQGFLSQIRGLKIGSNRPTRFIYDDATHSQGVYSQQQRDKMKRHFFTDITNAAQPTSTHFFIGTTIHKDDLITNLINDPMWKAKSYPSFIKWPTNMDLWRQWEKILSTGSEETNAQKYQEAERFYKKNKAAMTKGAVVLWPEREPVIFLMKERRKIGYKCFNAEKQNIPFHEGESLFKTLYWFHTEERDGHTFIIPEGEKKILYSEGRFAKYYAIDPATGERRRSTQKIPLSDSARVIGYKDIRTGVLYIMDVKLDRTGPSDCIKEMIQLHFAHRFMKMGFEENLFRDLFQDVIETEIKNFRAQTGKYIDLPVVPIWAHQKKEQRIYSIEPPVSAGRIKFNKTLIQNFISQLQDYPHSDKNDGLDALEILYKISNPDYNKLERHGF